MLRAQPKHNDHYACPGTRTPVASVRPCSCLCPVPGFLKSSRIVLHHRRLKRQPARRSVHAVHPVASTSRIACIPRAASSPKHESADLGTVVRYAAKGSSSLVGWLFLSWAGLYPARICTLCAARAARDAVVLPFLPLSRLLSLPRRVGAYAPPSLSFFILSLQPTSGRKTKGPWPRHRTLTRPVVGTACTAGSEGCGACPFCPFSPSPSLPPISFLGAPSSLPMSPPLSPFSPSVVPRSIPPPSLVTSIPPLPRSSAASSRSDELHARELLDRDERALRRLPADGGGRRRTNGVGPCCLTNGGASTMHGWDNVVVARDELGWSALGFAGAFFDAGRFFHDGRFFPSTFAALLVRARILSSRRQRANARAKRRACRTATPRLCSLAGTAKNVPRDEERVRCVLLFHHFCPPSRYLLRIARVSGIGNTIPVPFLLVLSLGPLRPFPHPLVLAAFVVPFGLRIALLVYLSLLSHPTSSSFFLPPSYLV
ncbi:hypothetical protein C8R44DRAFT_885651 [Mycena epipterygia]|nr:hypothetical protein C8R44DRAFT_885651 [Mycena epipterygia]